MVRFTFRKLMITRQSDHTNVQWKKKNYNDNDINNETTIENNDNKMRITIPATTTIIEMKYIMTLV